MINDSEVIDDENGVRYIDYYIGKDFDMRIMVLMNIMHQLDKLLIPCYANISIK